MSRSAIFGASFVVFGLLAPVASAQLSELPAEFPPQSYAGNQYIDSTGCAFIRAGVSGVTDWVPRVSRTREQLCGFKPTFANGAVPIDPLPANVPVITVAQAPAPAPAAAAPAPRPTPRRSGNGVGMPMQTIASIPASRPTPAAAPAPAPIASPQVIAPAPVAAPAPRQVTLAQACDGRTGIQAGFVSARTGKPIDCGGIPAPIAQIASVEIDIPQIAPPIPAPPRMTLAQACAGKFGIQRGFVSASTGNPIDCGPAPMTATFAVAANTAPMGPMAPGAAMMPAAPVAAAAPVAMAPVAMASSCDGITHMTNTGNLAVRCGPQAQSPSGATTAIRSRAAQVGRARVSTSTAPIANFANPPVPASNNPRVSTRAVHVKPPAGYENVWTDGRINPKRGLTRQPVAQQAPVAQAPVSQPRISSRSAPAAVKAPAAGYTGHRYVQVGSFGDHMNATRLIQRLGAQGLPVASGRSGALKIVAAGPFASQADLLRAQAIVRGMGFADAYTRN